MRSMRGCKRCGTNKGACLAMLGLDDRRPTQNMEIQFTTRIFKEGRTYVTHALELDISACAASQDKATRNLKEAVRLFLQEAEKMGTLEQIVEEAGYSKGKQKLAPPKVISVQCMSLPLPLTHA